MLNTQFTGTGFIPLDFTLLFLIGTQVFLDRKLFTSEIADIFHKFMFGIDIVSLRVSVYPTSVESGVLHSYLIQFSLCSTVTGMTLVSLVTLYSPSMIGSCAFIILGLYAVSNFYALVVRGHMLTYPCQSLS